MAIKIFQNFEISNNSNFEICNTSLEEEMSPGQNLQGIVLMGQPWAGFAVSMQCGGVAIGSIMG